MPSGNPAGMPACARFFAGTQAPAHQATILQALLRLHLAPADRKE